MDETGANGTQRGHGSRSEMAEEEALVVSDEVGDGADADVELRRRAQLRAMLTELVEREGPTKTAEVLGVSYKTVARAQKSGKVTDRMGEALERLLEPADDPEAARQDERIRALEESVQRLEGGVEALAKELREGLAEIRATASGNADAQAEHDGQTKAKIVKGARRSETGATPQAVRLRPTNPDTLQPFDAEIVTVEPADDDVEVYGDAWPLVEEWRRLRVGHPNRGRTLSWLENEERLLVLELAMLEEHGLTMPPEKQPLRGFGRSGQTNWRRTALSDTKVALRKRRLLRWVRRILTVGLWRK